MEFQQQPFAPPPAASDTYTPPVSAVNPVVRAIKELGRSALFLWFCIAQTAVAAFQVVVVWLNTSSGNNAQIDVFPILSAVALWMLRYTLCSNTSPFISLGGLKFIKVLTTIQLVLSYILAVCLPIVFLSLLWEVGGFEEMFGFAMGEGYLDDVPQDAPWFDEVLAPLLLGYVFIGFVVAVLLVIHGHLLRRGIATLTENCEGYLTDRSFPLYLVIECYVVAVFWGIFGLDTLLTSPWLAVIAFLNAAVFVLGAVILTKYRKIMEDLRKTSRESAYFSSPTPPPYQNM